MTARPKHRATRLAAALAASLLVASTARADEPAAPAAPAAAPMADASRPLQSPPHPSPPAAPPASVSPSLPITIAFAPPEGSAGPPTAAGTTGLVITPGLEIFAEYDLKIARTGAGTEWFHSFELPRAHGSLSGAYGPARARLVVEAVRSASEGALIGVAGDSFVMRLREASVGYRYEKLLAIDAGVVPTLTVPELDGTWNLRAVARTPLESTGLSSPADLGATIRVTFPKGYGFAAIGAYNGEGYASRELNRGKNLEGTVEIHPFAATAAAPLGVFASYVKGSTGTGRAQADRLTAAIVWQGRRVRGGAAFTYAWGVADAGDVRSIVADGFVRVEPIDRLIFGARGFAWMRDLADSTDRIVEVTGAAGYRVADPLEAFLAVGRTLPAGAAKEALPGLDHWDFRLIGRVVF